MCAKNIPTSKEKYHQTVLTFGTERAGLIPVIAQLHHNGEKEGRDMIAIHKLIMAKDYLQRKDLLLVWDTRQTRGRAWTEV